MEPTINLHRWSEMLDDVRNSRFIGQHREKQEKKYICEISDSWNRPGCLRVFTESELKQNPRFKRTSIRHITEISEDIIKKAAVDSHLKEEQFLDDSSKVVHRLAHIKLQSQKAHPLLKIAYVIAVIFSFIIIGYPFYRCLRRKKEALIRTYRNIDRTINELSQFTSADSREKYKMALRNENVEKTILSGALANFDQCEKEHCSNKSLSETYQSYLQNEYTNFVQGPDTSILINGSQTLNPIRKIKFVEKFAADVDRNTPFSRIDEENKIKDESPIKILSEIKPGEYTNREILIAQATKIEQLLTTQSDQDKWRYPLQAIINQNTIKPLYRFNMDFFNNFSLQHRWEDPDTYQTYSLETRAITERNIILKINRNEKHEIDSVEVSTEAQLSLIQRTFDRSQRRMSDQLLVIQENFVSYQMRCVVKLQPDGKPYVVSFDRHRELGPDMAQLSRAK